MSHETVERETINKIQIIITVNNWLVVPVQSGEMMGRYHFPLWIIVNYAEILIWIYLIPFNN